jgi:MFS transporter, putative metabolite transport protein
MDDLTLPEPLSALRAKSVQDHIDELPMWADGTPLRSAPMTDMQRLIWSLAAAGKFFAGFVVFMTGVAIPLLSEEFSIGPASRGIIGAASLFGILVGALALGGLSDRFGRKPMFVAEMVILVAFLVALTFSTSFTLVVICLFGIGLSLGCDYPTAHMIISENIPSASRGRLVLGAYAFQAIGALSGTAVGYLVLSALPKIDAWRWMYAAAIPPAVLVAIGRLYIVESANWLSARGEIDKAEKAARKLLVRRPQYPNGIKLAPHNHQPAANSRSKQTYLSLFNKAHWRATIFASVPWLLQDLGSYGIGIFTPTILAATVGASLDHVRSDIDLILNDIAAAKGTALITALLIVGVLFAILLTDTVGRVALQIFGFLGCAAGLLLASLSFNFTGRTETLLMFSGFMLFNFMTSLGPSAQTYLLSGEVFPIAIRGKGAGFAAAIGKIGAVATAFLFPILLDTIGTRNLLYGLIVTSILGAVVTWLFRIETRGVSLDKFEAGSVRATLGNHTAVTQGGKGD